MITLKSISKAYAVKLSSFVQITVHLNKLQDFCIETYKIIIELDGIQHFKEVKHFKNTLDEQRKRDLYKQKCANDNGYSVIRIYQEDVFHDTFDWSKELQDTIDKIREEMCVQNKYISKNDMYYGFETQLHDYIHLH